MPVLTDLTLRKMKPPKAGRRDVWDSKTTGLVFRVTATGSRSWSVCYRVLGQQRRLTLGAYRPDESAEDGLTLGQARTRARAVLRDVADGRDPAREKQDEKRGALAAERREGPTFADLAERFLLAEPLMRSRQGRSKGWRPKTRAEFSRLVRAELVPALGDLEPGEISKKHIRAVYDRIAQRSESVAKHTLAVLRLIYQWAAEEDHVDAVPVFPRRGTASAKRDRVLSEDELRAVLRVLDKGLSTAEDPPDVDTMAEAFRVLLLTAQRRGEVLSMRWADVADEGRAGTWWTIPAERSKSGREHRVPLTEIAVEALKRLHSVTGSYEYVFPSPKPTAAAPHVSNPQKAAERLWALAKVKGATLHDLRRTAASNMARLGVPRLVIGKVLGHADADVTGRYDRHAYDREQRAALRKWGDELQRIAASKPKAKSAKVLPWAK